MIEARGLVKRFGGGPGVVALDRVSFSVTSGEAFGVLGLDGAGKTTLLRILAGLVRPSAGTATIAGRDVTAEWPALRGLVGYIPQDPPMPREFTVRKYLEFWAAANGFSRTRRHVRVPELLRSHALEEVAGRRIHDCTTDAQRRLFLAVALLSDPEVLLLDEPMEGLSPSERDVFLDRVKALRDDGTTIVIVSTRLADMQTVSRRILTLANGRPTRPLATPSLLGAVGGARHARVFVDVPLPPEAIIPRLRALSGVLDARPAEPSIVLFVDPSRFRIADLKAALGAAGVEPRAIREAEITVGDIVRTIAKGQGS